MRRTRDRTRCSCNLDAHSDSSDKPGQAQSLDGAPSELRWTRSRFRYGFAANKLSSLTTRAAKSWISSCCRALPPCPRYHLARAQDSRGKFDFCSAERRSTEEIRVGMALWLEP